MRDLQTTLHLTQSVVSRGIGALSNNRRADADGYGLVELHEYPFDRRIKLARLTGKGTAYANRLRKALADRKDN
jgi:DNA-binding MarR family transcriptional regulator